jgi:hypothetical protein
MQKSKNISNVNYIDSKLKHIFRRLIELDSDHYKPWVNFALLSHTVLTGSFIFWCENKVNNDSIVRILKNLWDILL